MIDQEEIDFTQLEFTPLEFETIIKPAFFTKIISLEFTPLEFETPYLVLCPLNKRH